LEVYIVRIYRRDERHPRMIAGIVEEPGKPARKGFSNIDELRNIIGLQELRGMGLAPVDQEDEAGLPDDEKGE